MNLYESFKKNLKESEDIKEVSPDIISKYIEYWDGTNTSDTVIQKIYDKYDLLLANENGRWVAIDNRSGNCWTEEFPNKEDAIAWLRDEFEMDDYLEKRNMNESAKGKRRKRPKKAKSVIKPRKKRKRGIKKLKESVYDLPGVKCILCYYDAEKHNRPGSDWTHYSHYTPANTLKFVLNGEMMRPEKAKYYDILSLGEYEGAYKENAVLGVDKYADRVKELPPRPVKEAENKDPKYGVKGSPDDYIKAVADDMGVDLDSKVPFEMFYAPDSDDEDEEEYWYDENYDYADFYDRILHDMGYGDNPVVNDCRAEVHEVSDGSYEMSLFYNGKEYTLDIDANDHLEQVKDNVDAIIELLGRQAVKEAEVHTVDNDPIWKAAVEKVQKEYGIDKEVKKNDFESKRDFLYAMYDKIKEAWEAIEWHNEMYYEPDMYPTDLELILIVNWGDWKHDHIAIDHIAEQATHPIEISSNVTEEDGSDTYSAEHYYKYSEAQYKEWLKNGPLKEAEDYDPDFAVTSPIELNTGVLPIVDVDQYSRQDYIYSQEELMNDVEGDGSKVLEPGDEGYFEITTDKLDEAIMRIAPHVIENYIDVVLPGSKVEATKMYHPRQYNYGGDELEFKVSFVPDNYKQLEKEVTSNPEFKNFLKENYSSHSGFISSMADNLDEFYQQDGWKQFVQVVMFALKDHEDDMKDSEESMWEAIMQEVL